MPLSNSNGTASIFLVLVTARVTPGFLLTDATLLPNICQVPEDQCDHTSYSSLTLHTFPSHPLLTHLLMLQMVFFTIPFFSLYNSTSPSLLDPLHLLSPPLLSSMPSHSNNLQSNNCTTSPTLATCFPTSTSKLSCFYSIQWFLCLCNSHLPLQIPFTKPHLLCPLEPLRFLSH